MDKKKLGKIAQALIQAYGEEEGAELFAEIVSGMNKPTVIQQPITSPFPPTITWGETNPRWDWTKVTCGSECNRSNITV